MHKTMVVNSNNLPVCLFYMTIERKCWSFKLILIWLQIMSILSTRLQKYFFGILVFTAVVLLVRIPLRQTPLFEVSASIIIRHETKQSNPPRQGNRSSANSYIEGTITALEILNGNILSEQVINTIGGMRLFPNSSQKISSLLRQFKLQFTASPVSGTRIIKIFFRHQKPEVALDTLEALLRIFRKQYRDIQEPQTSLLEQQLLVYRKQMEQAEKKLSMFKKKNRMYAFGEYKPSLVAEQRQLQSQLLIETKKLKELSVALESMRQHYLAPEPSAGGAKGRNDFVEERTSLLDLKLYEYELLRKYEEEEPLISSVRQQIRMLKEQFSSGIEQKTEKLEIETEHIVRAIVEERQQQEKEATVRLQLDQIINKLHLLAKQKKTIKGLQAEAEKNRGRYTLHLNKIKESKPLPQSYITVIEKPVFPAKQVKPKRAWF
ncbi:MAG: hypothetical protein D3923_15660 [Candidatus Electrothrix sp. AR3]|nr:hypothetical protein [Candidatus Electrothrix sp. AR3]